MDAETPEQRLSIGLAPRRETSDGAKLAARRLRGGGRPVLVTGGAGFLGVNLTDRLARDGRRVIVLDSLARPGVDSNLAWLCERHGNRIVPLIADIRDEAVLRDAVQDAGAVIHLAAQVAVTTSLLDPVTDFEINARGTLNVLEALRRHPSPPPLIFASTNKVYGKLASEDRLEIRAGRWEPADDALARGCDEGARLDLYSPYGCSKGAADQYVIDYARVFGLRNVVLRMSCLYGPRQLGTEDQGWLAHFLIAGLQGQPLTIYGDGRQVRDVLFIDDAVEAYLRALTRIDDIAGRAFNLGGGPPFTLSLLELLALMRRLAGLMPDVRYGPWRPGDQRWYVSSTAAFEAATGWRATIDPETGVRRLLDWLKAHPLSAKAAQMPAEAVA